MRAACGMYGGEERCVQGFGGDIERKRSLGRRSRQRWEHNIKIDFKEMGWEGVDWIDLPEHNDKWQASENAVMNMWK